MTTHELLGHCESCNEPVYADCDPCYEFNLEERRDMLFHWDCLHRHGHDAAWSGLSAPAFARDRNSDEDRVYDEDV